MENLNAEAKEQILASLEWYRVVSSKIGSCTVDKLEIEAYARLIKELTDEVASLKQAMEHEHASFMETFGQYGEKCEELIKELLKRETEYNELYELTTEEIKRLRAEVSVKRKLLNVAEVRIECLEGENNQLKADICNATMNLEHITKENEMLRKNLETFKGKQKSLQKQIEVLSKENHLLLSKDFDITVGDCHIVFSNGKKGNIYTFTEKDQIAKEMLEGEK